jgi:hypothetical protein
LSEPAVRPPFGALAAALAGSFGGAAPGSQEPRLAIEPGQAVVRFPSGPGSRGLGHRLQVHVAPLAPEAWEPVLSLLAGRPALLGALLDGELPDAVVDAAGGDASLVPGRREVTVSCSCPARGRCAHARAAAWALAESVDLAPAALLTLRGRPPEHLAAAVRRRAAGRDAGDDEGVEAAFAGDAGRPPLPPALPPPDRAAVLAPSELPEGLGLLAADAAARARALRSGAGDGDLRLSQEADLARRGARLERDPSLVLMAQLAGVPLAELAEMAAAWQRGGAALVDVMYGSWSPPADRLAPARRLLGAHGPIRVRRNRVHLERRYLELRLGREGLWYLVDVSGPRPSLLYTPLGDPAPLVAARLGRVPAAEPRPSPAPAAGEQLSLL